MAKKIITEEKIKKAPVVKTVVKTKGKEVIKEKKVVSAKIPVVDNKFYRAAIVTVMGHVDHGKTSLLDAIRNTNVTAKESGGITQHIGAYTVIKDGSPITFIDTPGHEAFSQMRARGGKASDIIILVVAADDGVMPQTKEAISHAKAANVPIVVAINKCDLPTKDIAKVKRQLSENGIYVEGYGGDVVTVEVSAKTKVGIDNLLEVLNLIKDLNKDAYEADLNGKLEILIIEARHDPKKGAVVSGIIKNGTLKLRDDLVGKNSEGKVRAVTDYLGKPLIEVKPGQAVEILGFTKLPEVGDVVHRKSEYGEAIAIEVQAQVLNPAEILEKAKGKKLNLIIRADTQGTQEAIVASLAKIELEGTSPNVLFAGTGEVKESDILLASSASAIVVAFKVKVSDNLFDVAKYNKVIIREHDIIYKLLEEIEGALEGVVEIEESKIKGKGFVIEKFVLPKSGMTIAGTLLEAGKFKVNQRVGIFRGGNVEVPVYVTRIRSIHVGKNEIDTAIKGQECGLLFKPEINDIELDDEIRVL